MKNSFKNPEQHFIP